jgi:hydroxymethylpyrimidine pyrophosphatase-like HAD family hydrolase
VRYTALACDYDGTLAWDGMVSDETMAALDRLLSSGRRLIMVTGRELPDLMTVFPRLEIFERIVAENGALLYRPSTRESKVIGEEPPKPFIAALKARGVPFSLGSSIVATWTPHEQAVIEVIRNLGLELHVVFNKGSVMVLPSGVNKGTGLQAALMEMGLSPHNVVGVGDAENDHAFLALCECSVAVSNALPMLKERADVTTSGARGDGVRELIDEMIEDDLQRYESRLTRHHILLGQRHDGSEVYLRPYGGGVLIAGPAGSGKSSATVGILERLAEAGYQFCLIDSEGDYEAFDGSVTLGDSKHAPSPDEVLQLLRTPVESAVVNLLGISLGDRPEHFGRLLPRFQEVRSRAGRPHWLVLDEADHMLPLSQEVTRRAHPDELGPVLLVTGHPGDIATEALAVVDVVLAVGDAPEETLAAYAHALGLQAPEMPAAQPGSGEVVAWFRGGGDRAEIVRVAPARGDRRRHRRKYAEGDVGRESSFFFRGPDGRLNLRAQNLVFFMQVAEGVDDETWLHHLHQHDYSRWFSDAIKDDGLAREVERIERMDGLSAAESRDRVKAAIEERYTRPS